MAYKLQEIDNIEQIKLRHIVESFITAVPLSLEIEALGVLYGPYILNEIGLLIGMTGDINGKIYLNCEAKLLREIGVSIIGQPIDQRLLTFYACEFMKNVSEQICSILASNNYNVDVTVPTLLTEENIFQDDEKSFCFLINVNGEGKLLLDIFLED